MSIIIYNNPQSDTWRGRYTTFNHGHLEGIVLNCISLSPLSCSFTSPLMFYPSPFLVCLCIYLSLFSFTLSLSLSLCLALRPSYSLGLSPSALQLKLDSWIDYNGSSKRNMKSWKCVLNYVTHEHTYHLIRQSDELKSSIYFVSVWNNLLLFFHKLVRRISQ